MSAGQSEQREHAVVETALGKLRGATIDGVEKNTIESRIALSTSAAATASTASEPPIIVKRRCLRVMPGPCSWP